MQSVNGCGAMVLVVVMTGVTLIPAMGTASAEVGTGAMVGVVVMLVVMVSATRTTASSLL